MKDKPRRGRPVKPDSERRGAVVYLKVTPGEKELIDTAGAPEPTVWARTVLLKAAARRLK